MEVIIEGLDKLQEMIRDMPERMMPHVKKAMARTVEVYSGEIEQYPPATEANRPGRIDRRGRPMGYYERGAGWWYPVMKAQGPFGKIAHGLIKAKKGDSAAAYRLRRTSQQLNRSWTTEIIEGDGYVEGKIGSRATYWPFVVGVKQAAFHAARGWTRTDRALEAVKDDIQAAWDEALDAAIKDFGNG